jgi:hypothetical protein
MSEIFFESGPSLGKSQIFLYFQAYLPKLVKADVVNVVVTCLTKV